MINLQVDEGYAFDYLSILEIKKDKFPKHAITFAKCFEQVRQELGTKQFFAILDSAEYNNLRLANLKTFDAVDKAKYNLITAKEVDACNQERYKAKIALQNKFFKTPITEFKN